MSAFSLLSAPIREYVWDKGWPDLRPIQKVAIEQFMQTSKNLIIAAPTASGKTEAAFLPSISTVDSWYDGVKIIYISPLIALINDQFRRVEELSRYLDIPITSWHGEASQSAKKRLLKQPAGILLITPESIEAMLVRRPSEARLLFGAVETVIIDEIHSFLGTARGLHLQSLLVRTAELVGCTPRYIGLSATIPAASYVLAKSFFGTSRETAILLDHDTNTRDVTVRYIPSDEGMFATPPDLLDNLFKVSTQDRLLVFPNARAKVEEIAVGLQRRATAVRANVRYFAHHASVDKELRLEAEAFAKASTHDLFTICCTSTLELGIDIGSVDTVVQIDAPHSVASLAQRLGRSGRRSGVARLVQYATSPWSLLQSLAALSLLEDGLLDPVEPLRRQHSMLFQQALSLLLQTSGMTHDQLVAMVMRLPAAADVSVIAVRQLVSSMVERDYIERSDDVLIVGLSAERIVTSRGFYAHFQDKADFTVLVDGRRVGELPLTPDLTPQVNVFLAGKIWKILDIDTATRKIFVERARDGKPPKFGGEAGNVSLLLRQRMHDLLTNERGVPAPAQGDVQIQEALSDLSQQTGTVPGSVMSSRRIVADKLLYTFAGSRINYTLRVFLLMRTGEVPKLDDSGESSIECSNLAEAIGGLIAKPVTDEELRLFMLDNPSKRPPLSGKYMVYLPDDLLVDELLAQYFTVDDTNAYLSSIRLQ